MTTRKRFLLGVLCGLLALPVCATNQNTDVAVSPTVLVSKSKSQAWITVHANVPIWEVDRASASLIILAKDGSAITVKPVKLLADDCGDLVAKFDSDDVREALPVPQKATLVFQVYRLDGTLFSGSAVLIVK